MDRFNQRFSHNKPKNSSTQPSKGFSMNAVPPPSSLSGGWSINAPKHASGAGVSKHGYSTMDAISQFANTTQYTSIKRRAVTEDELVYSLTFLLI